MKNKLSSIILSAILVGSISTSAQNSGRVVYEQKTKLNIDIDEEHQAALANVPKEHVSSRVLIFDSTASIFQKAQEKSADETIQQESEHGPMVIKMTEPDDKMYADLVEKKRLEQRDYMSRTFLIEIPFSASMWKLTGNQRKILNYTCQEAILQDTMRKVKAWFTPEIPVSTGPQGICNLPGLVLAAEMKGGDVTFEAKSVELIPIDHKKIVKPKEGKKVTRDEFNQMVMEKQKEMDEQGEGNGNVIIRVRK